MHKMANTKIKAEDDKIWGEVEMTPDNIKRIKTTVEKYDYQDRDYLLEVLNRWENNDFSKSVEEHNYFWDKLGGNVGKAVGLK